MNVPNSASMRRPATTASPKQARPGSGNLMSMKKGPIPSVPNMKSSGSPTQSMGGMNGGPAANGTAGSSMGRSINGPSPLSSMGSQFKASSPASLNSRGGDVESSMKGRI